MLDGSAQCRARDLSGLTASRARVEAYSVRIGVRGDARRANVAWPLDLMQLVLISEKN